ncbi:hypothetical protein D0869_00736 [Hortaea werneckii]|uniref:Uncharacterized protein n=1 Tax=Hortaea werneckii TaxID=91943 RepID=A0A3M6XGJ9_HORWE|nr:hypothetical protein D0869_00736 [Hortaea werneckii]
MDSSQQQDISNLAKTISSLTITEQHQPRTQQTSPLLTPPPELRNKIYSLALTSPFKTHSFQNRTPQTTRLTPNLPTNPHRSDPNLPLNPSNLVPLHAFLRTCGKANLAVLHKLELQYAVCAAATGDAYAHPSTRQSSILALLYLLAEAGVGMWGLEASTARCKCQGGGRCRTTARAWVYAFEMLVGGFRGSGAEGGRVGVEG